MKATDLRSGIGIKIDGKVAVLVSVEHRTPGNLRAFIQIKYKEIASGKTIERRLGSSDTLDTVDLDRRPMEYLYSDSTGATFMDAENYDQMVLHKDVLGDALQYMNPNTSAVVLCIDGNPVSIELPPTVELKVAQCDPAVKNATVTNVMKDCTMETGLKTKVPDFINIGEVLRIATADGAYQSRA
jgi:elongation factor P